MKPVLHPVTHKQLGDFKERPSHALILVGAKGMGKRHVAEYLAEQLLELPEGGLSSYPYSLIISPDAKGTISIESVRSLEDSLKLKVPSSQAINRLVIIEDGQALGAEAQNALLKTLEEPPQGTLLILTVTSPQDLLPTIVSRGQQITIKRPNSDDLTDYFNQQELPETAISQALAMTGGLPGSTHALLIGDDHPLKAAVAKARELLAQSSYERMLQVEALSKDKQLANDVLFILQQMAHVSLQTAEGARAEQWRRIMEASYDAEVALQANAQTKLVLDDFLLKI